jgi:HSP20 family protein
MSEAKKEVAISKGELAQRAPLPLTSRLEDVERFFDDFFGRGWVRPLRWVRPTAAQFGMGAPRIDVIDRDSEVIVRAEVPGIEKDDIEISISGTMLTVKGGMKRESSEQKGDYWRAEIFRGSFTRTLALPAEVNEEKADAMLKGGLLELRLPKIERRHKIEVH